DEQRARDEELEKENMKKAQVPMAEKSISDALKCGKCGQKKVSYSQAQTRSADEPMTTFCECTVCGNRWKVCAHYSPVWSGLMLIFCSFRKFIYILQYVQGRIWTGQDRMGGAPVSFSFMTLHAPYQGRLKRRKTWSVRPVPTALKRVWVQVQVQVLF